MCHPPEFGVGVSSKQALMRKCRYSMKFCPLLTLAGLLAAACTPTQYARQADHAAYDAVQDARRKAALETVSWSIDYRPYQPAATQSATAPAITVNGKALPIGTTQPAVLAMDEALEIAFRNSRAFQDQKEDLYRLALAAASARRTWDYPFPQGDVTASASRDVVNHGSEANAAAVSAQPTLVQRFRSGGLLTLGYALTLATDFTGGDATAVGSLLSADLTQPLLRGAWVDAAYEPLYRLERDLLFAAYAYERFTQTFATDILTQYYQALRQRDALENDAANIVRLKETFALTKVLVQGGQVSRIEQDQAEQNLLDAHIRFQQTRQEYQNALDQFKIALGIPIRASLELDYPGALEKLTQAGPLPMPWDEEQAVAVAYATRPDVLTQAARVRDAGRNVELAADRFLPQLDLELGISAPGTSPREFDRVQFNRHRRFARVNFNYPIDQTDNRDVYRLSLIDQDKSRRDFARFLDQVRLDVVESFRQLRQSRSSYDLQVRSVEIAKRRRKLAALQQREGQASARDVLEAEEALRLAQNGLTGALVDYTTLRLRFLSTLGMVFVDGKGQVHERKQPATSDATQRRYPYASPP